MPYDVHVAADVPSNYKSLSFGKPFTKGKAYKIVTLSASSRESTKFLGDSNS